MRLLANENFPLKSNQILRDKGFDTTIMGIECAGVTDREVMEIVIDEDTIRQRRYKPHA